jgi:hypothetical protein
MPQEAERPCTTGAPLVLCDCGTVLMTCERPGCTAMHLIRTIPACGVCTATGGQPDEEVAHD